MGVIGFDEGLSLKVARRAPDELVNPVRKKFNCQQKSCSSGFRLRGIARHRPLTPHRDRLV